MADLAFGFNGCKVRVVLDAEGAPWWVARDVCDALGISKYRDAIASLADDEGCPVMVDTLGGKQSVTAISEPGLYRLIFASRKPAAEAFKRWLAHEVLPAIRRTGRYEMTPAEEDPPVTSDYWLGLVREARLTHGRAAAARVWAMSPLPQVTRDTGECDGVAGLCAEFLQACCIVTGDNRDFIKSRRLLRALEEFCAVRGVPAPGDRTASLALRRVSASYSDPLTGKRMRPIKRSDAGYSGVRLKAAP